MIFGSRDFQLGNPNRWKIFRGWKYAYIYRLNTKIRLRMLCLSGFELYSRWVPLNHACQCLSFDSKTATESCNTMWWSTVLNAADISNIKRMTQLFLSRLHAENVKTVARLLPSNSKNSKNRTRGTTTTTWRLKPLYILHLQRIRQMKRTKHQSM